jgi:transposase
MSSQIQQLFRAALGLAEPWVVSKIEFSDEQHQLDLHLDFPAGSRFPCPQCQADCGVYDSEERTWRHLNFFQHKTFLHARQPRVHCAEHGVKTVAVPWARPGAGFTLLMEAFLLVLVQGGMTAAQAARLVDEHDTRLWRVLRHYVDEARAREDFSKVKVIGVDETSRSKGQNYITVFMDLEEDRRRVLYATEGRDAETVGRFRADLESHGGSAGQIEEACLDMSAAYIKGLGEQFPKAQQTFDPFHVMQVIGEAIDEIRRQEQPTHPELKGTRYVWLRNEWNRNAREKETFERLRFSHLATVRATHMRSVFQDIMGCYRPIEDAEGLLKQWYFWATHSRIAPLIQAAKTIKRHWAGVLRWFVSRVSNGVVEAINGLIQTAKAKARGFRNSGYLITMVYLIAAKLDFRLPDLGYPTHTK